MSTITGPLFDRTTQFLKDNVEPAMHKIVDEVNKLLAKQKVRVGCEIQWFVLGTDDEDDKTKKKS